MIKRIWAESSEEACEVDVEVLHETLLMLPADKYLRLYRLMQQRVEDERNVEYLQYNYGHVLGDASLRGNAENI